MKKKINLPDTFKVIFPLLFFLLGAGLLSCNSPESREQENELRYREEEMPHNEDMHDEEMIRDGHMMDHDTMHTDSVRGNGMREQER